MRIDTVSNRRREGHGRPERTIPRLHSSRGCEQNGSVVKEIAQFLLTSHGINFNAHQKTPQRCVQRVRPSVSGRSPGMAKLHASKHHSACLRPAGHGSLVYVAPQLPTAHNHAALPPCTSRAFAPGFGACDRLDSRPSQSRIFS
jgi:hypothetical protein